MKDAGESSTRGWGQTILPPLTLPSHVGWKGRGYVKSPISMTTSCLPLLWWKEGEGPYIFLEAFPPRLQVVVNRVRAGCGRRGTMAESLSGRAAHSRLGLTASVTNCRASQLGWGTAAQNALVPLVGGPTKAAGARASTWDSVSLLILT